MPKPFRELTITLNADQIEIVQKSLERTRMSMSANIKHSNDIGLPTLHLEDSVNQINKLLLLFNKEYKF